MLIREITKSLTLGKSTVLDKIFIHYKEIEFYFVQKNDIYFFISQYYINWAK